MDKIIVAVFDNETNAFKGSKALDELNHDGTITLYASGVIGRPDEGSATVLQEAPNGPIGTGVGLLAGSLIGLLGGPVGAVVGAYVGSISGMAYDFAKVGVGEDFLDEVGQYLLPGKAAVVAEVWEEWTRPIDARMEALGGTVFRRPRTEYYDVQIAADADAFRSEISELEDELTIANAEEKVKLQVKIEAARAKLHSTQEKAKKAVEDAKREMDAKIESLKQQMAKANAETKVKLEERVEEIKSENRRRNEKLRQAWELTKEAAAI
jgi:uncharacterized membrane protein